MIAILEKKTINFSISCCQIESKAISIRQSLIYTQNPRKSLLMGNQTLMAMSRGFGGVHHRLRMRTKKSDDQNVA